MEKKHPESFYKDGFNLFLPYLSESYNRNDS